MSDEVMNGRVDWQAEKCRDWLDQNDGSTTDTDDRLKKALYEFEVDWFGSHGTCNDANAEGGYTPEYYSARFWYLKERGLELPDEKDLPGDGVDPGN